MITLYTYLFQNLIIRCLVYTLYFYYIVAVYYSSMHVYIILIATRDVYVLCIYLYKI